MVALSKKTRQHGSQELSKAADQDMYFKKIVVLRYGEQALRLRVAQDLFSSFEVDVGTKLLLRTLPETNHDVFPKILDLGCGYGPIGLALKKVNEERVIHMVDRDALAVDYSRQNAQLNDLFGVEIYGSLGYDDVSTRDFDLIISNIPGKAGEPVIASFLRDVFCCLRPGGLVAIVVVAPLKSRVEEILNNTGNINVIFRKSTSDYAIFHYQFSSGYDEVTRLKENGMERGVYHRKKIIVSYGDLEYTLDTAYDLPEFDTLSFRSGLLIETMREIKDPAIRHALVFNPGQGHIPVALWKLVRPDNIDLVDRDLLSLRCSRNNLILNGCSDKLVTTSHQMGILVKDQRQFDLIVGVLRESEGTGSIALTIKQAADQLSPGGTILVAGSSTAVTRLVKLSRSQKLLRIDERKRRRRAGNSVLVLNHK